MNEYRILEPHEVIQEGDEWDWENNWTKTRAVGQKVEENHGRIYRRPIPTVAKDATVDAPDFSTTRDQLLGEVEKAKDSFASYVESMDAILDEAKIPYHDAVGRVGPIERVKWLIARRNEEKAEGERLTKERDELKRNFEEETKGFHFSRDQWVTENAKLREAVEKIVNTNSEHNKSCLASYHDCLRIAREALAEKGKE